MRKVEEPRQHALLASPDACGLLASVLAVVERGGGRGPWSERSAVLLYRLAVTIRLAL